MSMISTQWYSSTMIAMSTKSTMSTMTGTLVTMIKRLKMFLILFLHTNFETKVWRKRTSKDEDNYRIVTTQ